MSRFGLVRGNSFAMGSHANNGTNSNGPHDAALAQGWDTRPWSHWDYTEGRVYL